MYGAVKTPASRVARVGHLYPSGGLCDDEIQLMAPTGVQFLTTRLPFRATGVADDLALADDLELHAGLLADAAVNLIAFNCTAASMLLGPEPLRRRIAAETSLPVVTTIEAVVEPFLVREGLIGRTPRGRIATPAGLRHAGVVTQDATLDGV